MNAAVDQSQVIRGVQNMVGRLSVPNRQSASKYTPGPWGYIYDGSSDWTIGEARDPQENPVAHIWDRNDARAHANARLIAQAPTMLKIIRCLATYDSMDPIKIQDITEARAILRAVEGDA